MKKTFLLVLLPLALIFSQCKPKTGSDPNSVQFIAQSAVDSVIGKLNAKYGDADKTLMEKGVRQVAALWTEKDGTAADFEGFCLKYFVNGAKEKEKIFHRLSDNFETLWGHFGIISLRLKQPIHLSNVEKFDVDEIFGAYDPQAHFNDDFFANKVAFVTALNFPYYTLKEKDELGAKWSRLEWAYARMGDVFTARVPAEVTQKVADAYTSSDNYISDYNIYVGNLIDNEGKTHFPKEMCLLSHWNLRDELKSNYNKGEEGLLKQKMIYEVMLHIVNQDIPDSVINNPALQWNPYTNKVFRDGKEIACNPEPNTRYEMLLNNFKAYSAVDRYTPMMPTYIQRAFNGNMEISVDQTEALFGSLLSSPQVKQVAALVSKRLGRPLQPFDIWYDGFKSRSSLDQAMLNQATRAKYPDPAAFEKDIPNILIKIGFKPEKAKEIASHIAVDPARGSGHAQGAAMKGDKAHLRTRIAPTGMDYKGYNIAVHELGHNVEQTIDLYDVDYYMLNGVPNTAFTEALAYTFQKRDLEFLGIKDNTPNKEEMAALDNFWASYEIMGVSMIDIMVWKWLYENPNATKEQLHETVVKSAKDVWDKYYADVFGVKECPLMAIYSHMIDNPLYLSNYAVGHLIDFQLDRYFKGKDLSSEIYRIFTLGRLTPQQWMKDAVGQEISIKPLLDATDEALKVVK